MFQLDLKSGLTMNANMAAHWPAESWATQMAILNADPAWLAVLLAILVGYKQGKESLREIMADAARLGTSIRNQIHRQLELLRIAVGLALGRLLQAGEGASLRMAWRLRRTRLWMCRVSAGGG